MSPRPVVIGLALLIALAATSRPAAAQYGYPAYGYGGWGTSGWGGYPMGGMGMSPYGQAYAKEAAAALANSRYELETAEAARSYMAAAQLQQQAINTALQNQRLATEAVQERYSALTGRPLSDAMAANRPAARLESLFQSDGSLAWPKGTPRGGALDEKRQDAENAIRGAYQAYKENGRADVRSVVDAGTKLDDFGRTALSRLPSRNRVHRELAQYLQFLTTALAEMGGSAP